MSHYINKVNTKTLLVSANATVEDLTVNEINLNDGILTYSGTTGNNELVFTDNVADALSIKDAGGTDYAVFVSSTGSEAVQLQQDTVIATGKTLQLVSGDLTISSGNVVVSGNVDGRDVSTDGSTLDNLNTTIGLSALTGAEVDQLENIGVTTISATQWGYLGASDQALATTDTVSFADLTVDEFHVDASTVTLSGVTGANELVFPDNLAEGLVLRSDTTAQDYVVLVTTDAAEAVQLQQNTVIATGKTLQLVAGDLTLSSGNVVVSGNVDGRDVSADGLALDNLVTTIGLSALTSGEVDQLENIGATTVSATQWGYLGATDQALATTDTVSFADLTVDQVNLGDGAVTFSGATGANEIVLPDNLAEGLVIRSGTTEQDYMVFVSTDASEAVHIQQSATVATGKDLTLTSGTFTVTGQADVDNLRLNGNVLSSTDTNGNVSLLPDGTGEVLLKAAPVSALGAATKAYVDGIASGVDVRESCRVKTHAALPSYTQAGDHAGATLTGASGGSAVSLNTAGIDGITNLVVGDRVLVDTLGSAADADNGIYEVTVVGVTATTAWVLTRTSDADQDIEVTANMFCFVSEGTANSDSGWVVTSNDPLVVDTDPIVWTQFSQAGVINAANVGGQTGQVFRDKVGNTLNFKTVGVGSTKISVTNNADNISFDLVQTNITATGALDGGSITANFGSINNGSSAITTTGTVTGGSTVGGNVTVTTDTITFGGTEFANIVLPVDITSTLGNGNRTMLAFDTTDSSEVVISEVLLQANANIDLDGYVEFDAAAAPGTPAATEGRVYMKTGSTRLFFKNESGTEYDLTGASLAHRTDSATAVNLEITDNIVTCSGDAGAITATLPTLATSIGQQITVINNSSSETVTVKGDGTESIDGTVSQTIVLTTQHDRATLMCNGVSWYSV